VSRFEYVTVLMSFVVAFGVSEILAGWGRQFLERDRVRPYPLQLFASFLLLILLLQSLWGYWNFRDVHWTFPRFLAVLAPLLVLSSVTFLITPSLRGKAEVLVRDHYLGTRRVVFLLLAACVALGTVAEVIVVDPRLHVGQAIRGVAVVLFCWLAVTRNEGVHWAVLCLLLVLQAVFIGSVTPELE
jgi:hypothetical protein